MKPMFAARTQDWMSVIAARLGFRSQGTQTSVKGRLDVFSARLKMLVTNAVNQLLMILRPL
jgi:hypothetical protein